MLLFISLASINIVYMDGQDISANHGAVTSNKQLYKIPDEVKKKYPDLVELIKNTESMNDDERNYWFQILPVMTDEQIKNLREILLDEKRKLEELDKKYQSQIKNLNTSQKVRWHSIERRKKKQKICEAEKKAEELEMIEEQKILKDLENS